MKRIALIIIFSCIPLSAFAGDNQGPRELERIVVSASRTEAQEYSVGSAYTLITDEEISESQKHDVSEILRATSGLTVVRTGGAGGLTTIYLRGAKAGHTLVMIDGVEVNDPTESDRSFDFSHLTTDNIERIEVVRGPQSTLYGSDALAGVVNVITKKGRGKPKISFSTEGGSYHTYRESLGFNGSKGKADYSLLFARLDSRGLSQAKDGSEKDKQRSTVTSCRLGYKVLENSRLDFIFRRNNMKNSIDDGAFLDDPNSTSWYDDALFKLEFSQDLKRWCQQKFAYNYFAARRKYRDAGDEINSGEDYQSWYKGSNQKFAWQADFLPWQWNISTLGFEYEEERGNSSSRSQTAVSRLDRTCIHNRGYYLQEQLKFKQALFVSCGVRLDDHQLFGVEDTYKVSAKYILPTQTALKFNWGSGFKAPSIYQLYSTEDWGSGPIGDAHLSPDKSKGYDFGFEQGLFAKRLLFGLSYFRNRIRNMVDYDMTLSKYLNIGQVKTWGLEFSTTYRPIEALSISCDYTLTHARDRETGRDLARRSRNQAGLGLDWDFLKKAHLNLKAIYVGHNWNDADSTQKVKPYSKFDLALSYLVLKDIEIFSRIENLLNRNYQEVRGYSSCGRNVYAGIKGEF